MSASLTIVLISFEVFFETPFLADFFPVDLGFPASDRTVKFGVHFQERYHLSRLQTLSALITSAIVCEHSFIDLYETLIITGESTLTE